MLGLYMLLLYLLERAGARLWFWEYESKQNFMIIIYVSFIFLFVFVVLFYFILPGVNCVICKLMTVIDINISLAWLRVDGVNIGVT